MKWVKATERLPKVPENASGLIIIREIKNPDNYQTSWFSNLPGGRGNGSLLKKHPERYEWLDEDAPSTSYQVLVDALQNIDVYSDVADPPFTPKQFGDIARKALASLPEHGQEEQSQDELWKDVLPQMVKWCCDYEGSNIGERVIEELKNQYHISKK